MRTQAQVEANLRWAKAGQVAASEAKNARLACSNGHPWTDESTYRRGKGQGRACRICRRAAAERYAAKRRVYLDTYKRERGCVDCGTTEGRLDLDHRPGETKLFDLSKARVSWDRLHAELAKCDVRCIACHARRHGVARGGLQPPTEVIVLPVVDDAAMVCGVPVA